MTVIQRTGISVSFAGIALMMTGCMSGDVTKPAAVEAERTVAREAEPSSETPVSLSPLEQILADRERGEFPEIETDAAGFTITEQVRIGSSARTLYQQARQFLDQERLVEAIATLSELTEEYPEVTAPWIDLGIAYGESGDLENAVAALETATRLSPGHPIAQNELGIAYRRSGQFDQARDAYEMALSVFSDFHYARRNLAVLCDLYLADSECALQNYQMYLESVGEDSEVEIWIADLASRSGQDLGGGM